MCLIVSHTCQLKYLHIRSYAYITVNNFALSNTLVVSASCTIENHICKYVCTYNTCTSRCQVIIDPYYSMTHGEIIVALV